MSLSAPPNQCIRQENYERFTTNPRCAVLGFDHLGKDLRNAAFGLVAKQVAVCIVAFFKVVDINGNLARAIEAIVTGILGSLNRFLKATPIQGTG